MRSIIILIVAGFILSGTSSYSQLDGEMGSNYSCDTIFTDKGGLDGNYGNNEDYSVTFCSRGDDQVLRVVFESILLEENNDKLQIFEGSQVTGLPAAELDGTKKRFVFTSGSSCVTFRFISDGSGTNAGWFAKISCIKPSEAVQTRNIVVNSNAPYNSADYLVQDVLVTGCLTAWNVTSKGAATQRAYFNGNACPILGFKEGVVLGTGNVNTIVPGPNYDGAIYDDPGTPGDDMLKKMADSLFGFTDPNYCLTYNASILEFDFRPESDKLQFRYAFASDEYPEFNCTGFNDVFGFFLTGPNPGGGNYNQKNIALVPGKNVPVCVNSINTGNTNESGEDGSMCVDLDPQWKNNSIYYKTNNGNDLQFDGLTVPLTAEANVVPCKTYHIKLAIADVGDASWESAVFLEANSFMSGEGVEMNFEVSGGGTDTNEGCSLTLTFTRADDKNINTPYNVLFTVGGTATPDVDYQSLPATVTIPAGQMTITYTLPTYNDAIAENFETVVLTLTSSQSCPCQGQQSNTATVNIFDNPLKVTITNIADICVDSSANLIANITGSKGPYTYKWSNGVTYSGTDLQHSINVKPAPGTPPYPVTYYVTVTDACGSTSVDDVTFNVIICGGINLTLLANPNEICRNECTDLSAVVSGDYTEPYSVVWNNGVPSGIGPHTVCPTTTTVYSATVTDQAGHSATSSVTVTVNSLPVITFTTTNTTCAGTCYGLANATITNGIPAYQYQWSNNQTTNPAINLCAGSYTLTVTDSKGCTGSGTTTITEPLVLGSTINGTNDLCSGTSLGSAEVTPSGGTPPYQYKWSNTISDSVNTNLSAGIYTVTITDANGCTVKDSIEINEPYPITIQLSQTNLKCYGSTSEGSASVTVTGGGTTPYEYKWSNNQISSTINNISAGIYYVTVTDKNLCTSTGSVTITQPVELEVSIPVVNKICIGQSVTLTAEVTGGTQAYNILWNNQSTGQTLTMSPTVTTTYTVTVLDANNCKDIASQTVQVYPPLSITAYVGDTTLCPGECTEIVVNVGGGKGIGFYTIKLDDGSVIQSPHTVCPTVTTTYTITGDDNCTQPTVSTSVTIYALPQPPVDFYVFPATGCVPLTVQFNEISPVIDNTKYQWDFGDLYGNNTSTEKNPKHKFNEPGTYTITCKVESEAGCKNSMTKNQMITVYPNPIASFLAHSQVTTTLKPVIQFENTSSTMYYNLWQFGDGDTSNTTHPQHKYSESGTYKVKLYIETEHGCPDETEMEVIIQDVHTFYAPDAFTPDYDEMNKLFSPIGVGIDKNHWDLRIYDRWGELVFQTNIYDVDENGRVKYGWDGRIKGKDMGEIAEYPWICIYRDFTGKEHTRSGVVILLR